MLSLSAPSFRLLLSLLSFSSVTLEIYASNKESFSLCRENFSTDIEIDFKGLSQHLHHRFQDESLLQDALYPLLPQTMRHSIQKFEQLEFLGDAVLGLVVKERILALFPQESRGRHNDLYQELSCNKTLTEIYQRHLNLERYLPDPGSVSLSCKYCDLVEALIGAIYQDSQSKGLKGATKFIALLLDDSIIAQKWQQINTLSSSSILGQQEQYLFSRLPVLPTVQSILKTLSQTRDVLHRNPKTVLAEMMSQMIQDQPQYTVALGRGLNKEPGFIVHVSGAQIGHTLSGFGETKSEAEEEAARQAVNFIAGKEYLPVFQKESQIYPFIDYARVVAEYCQLHPEISLSGYFVYLSQERFQYTALLEGVVIGEARGFSKKEAHEKAAHQAYDSLYSASGPLSTLPTHKNYRMLLNELCAQGKICGLVFKENHADASPLQLQYKIEIGDEVIAHTHDLTKEGARQKAYELAFDYLQERQERASKISFQKIEKIKPGRELVQTPKITKVVKTNISFKEQKSSSTQPEQPVPSLNEKGFKMNNIPGLLTFAPAPVVTKDSQPRHNISKDKILYD